MNVHHGAADRPLTTRSVLTRANPDILTVAHRGVWANAPENSLAAIRAAIVLGVEIVEIDAQATADGAIVVIHDETLDRTTTGRGPVAAAGLTAIRALRLRAGPGGADAAPTPERMPTLAEALEEARGKILVNVDTKYERHLDAVGVVVLDLGMADQVVMKTDVDLDGASFPVAKRPWFGRIAHMPMFPVRPDRFADDLRRIEPLVPPMVEVKFRRVADLIAARQELVRQDVRLWINTLDVSHCLDFNDSRALAAPDDVWGTLVAAGVGAIQTDESAAFKAWLAGRGEAS